MKKKSQLQLSYESDGNMGKQKKEKNNNKEQKDFFNTTQGSE
jgi:hypothetical protein